MLQIYILISLVLMLCVKEDTEKIEEQDVTQTSGGGRLRLVCFRVEGFQARALTLLTQHVLD